MGSPISVVLAELAMQLVEKQIFENANEINQILLWKRYIDDVISIVPKTSINQFHQFINSINQDIQFTYEIETNNSLPYLDMLIQKSNSGQLSFNIYRKPTNTGQYLKFNSNHPITHKKSVVSSLFHRS